MAYADYAYYTSEYLGTAIPEEEFPRLAARSSDYIDYITWNRAANNPELAAVKKACCALAELYQSSEQAMLEAVNAVTDAEGAALASQTVGSWTKTYHSRAELLHQAGNLSAQTEGMLYSIAARYLATTGLLYRGGRCK